MEARQIGLPLKMLVVFFLICFHAFPVSAVDSLKILRITPEGYDVPVGRQIVFQFDRPVVPLGRMERTSEEIPISIEPPLACEWRWLNRDALACQLTEAEAFKPATRYSIRVSPGISDESGVGMAEPVSRYFVTIRPAVRNAWFKTWRSPGMPVIQAAFTQPVSKSSIDGHMFFRLNGERAGLNVEPDADDREIPAMLPLPGEKAVLVGGEAPSKTDDQRAEFKGEEARRVWLLSPSQEFSPDAYVELKVEPGLVSALGPETGVEDRVVVAFDAFPEFNFLGVQCFGRIGESVHIPPEQELKYQSRCDPLSSVSLVFSSPVIADEVKANVLISPDLRGGREDYDPWASVYRYSQLSRPHKRSDVYYVRLPEVLKAFETYSVELGAIKDEFGRTLAGAGAMQFRTDHRRPSFYLNNMKAVLEKGVDSEVPAVVTNLEKIKVSFNGLTTSGPIGAKNFEIALPRVEDVSYRTPMKVRDMLEGRSGALSGAIGTSPKVINPPHNIFFAQVTPFQVHVKLGHFNTLVWVADLSTGEPVADAKVAIYEDTYYFSLAGRAGKQKTAVTDGQGLAFLPGTEELDPNLNFYNRWDDSSNRLFVRVDKGDDLALLPLDRNFSVEVGSVTDWTLWSDANRKYGHLHAWGTTAQGVYRAGDAMQYKIYVRNQDNNTFTPPPAGAYSLEIIDPTGNAVHKIPDIKLATFGAFDGEWQIPKKAAVGWYSFKLKCEFPERNGNPAYLYPMRVLVADFTPSPFRASAELNGDLFRPGDEMEATTLAKLHAGGPYADAQTRLTAVLNATGFQSSDPVVKTFYFDVSTPGGVSSRILHQTEFQLDKNGENTVRFSVAETPVLYGRISVESAVRDDRGKYIAGFASADYAGRDRYVGLRSSKWMFNEDEPAEIEFITADEKGKIFPEVQVKFKVERLETKAARVKGAGNAYLTRYVREWIEAGGGEAASASEPGVYSFIPDQPGTYRATASITDSKGSPHSTRLSLWVAGRGQVTWEEPSNNSLTIVPEKEKFKVGETARYMIKNPFPGAKALITVERYGVLKSWVQTLEGSMPVVEFPVEPDFLPGFFFSATVFSPRIDKPLGPDNVDLGKPAFRMGYVAAEVKDPLKTIDVKVKTEKETYKPRQKVKVKLSAGLRSEIFGEPIEFAVAVLDEAVFDLIAQGRGYFDPYEGFYSMDDLDLTNYSLLTMLVGRQKFEKKGANAGGGGGDLGMRSLFKFVSYWNPSIIADMDGEAEIEFETPDNLTGWRILAMAATPGDRMGLGDAVFKVNRPTELRPVMPNQVLEGDVFSGGFSVMNRTGQSRKLEVSISAEGAVESVEGGAASVVKTVELEPFKRKTVRLTVKTSSKSGGGKVIFRASAKDGLDADALRHEVPIGKRRSLLTAAVYGSIPKAGETGDVAIESVLFPENIHADAGGLTVVGYPSAIGNVDGAFRYMRDYPYECWEQILTKGAMASHYNNLKDWTDKDLVWEESEKLPQQILDTAAAFQAPNGGMSFWVPQDSRVSPYLSAYTAMAFNWLRASGHSVPQAVEEKLHGYLGEMLRRDVMPTFYSKGMASTVRAVALAALSEHGKISVADLGRHAPHLGEMSLFGKAQFLAAGLKSAPNDPSVAEAAKKILAASSQSGGKFQFLETLDDAYSQLLATPLKANCAILSAFTKMASTPGGKALVGDVPTKLVRTITQSRGNRDHWENTQENVFCMNALVDYSRAYESVEPDMTFRASVDERPMGEANFDDVRDKAVSFIRPITESDPGRKATVKIERDGVGRLYYSTRLQYAPTEESASRINAGIEIRREYSVERDGQWILLESPMNLAPGDLVRVDLFVSLPATRHFVVVDDPVPGGLEPVNRDLATTSTIDADKGAYKPAGGSWWFQYSDWSDYGVALWSFYHQELRHDSARFYADYLPPGNYHLSYAAQAIAPGEFGLMPVHVEEMYDPDVFGKGLPASLKVEE